MPTLDQFMLTCIAVLVLWILRLEFLIFRAEDSLTDKIERVRTIVDDFRRHTERDVKERTEIYTIYTEDGYHKVWMKEVVEALLKKLKMEVGYTCIHPKVELISIKSKPVKRTRRGRTNG